MQDHGHPPRRFNLGNYHPAMQWGILIVFSFILAWLFDIAHLPAAVLLGSMLAAIPVAITEGSPRIPRNAFIIAQGVIGCLVARSITPDILVSLRQDWLLFVSVTVIVVLACAGMGWVLAKKRVLPGTTAVWGSSPGGASVMVLMADSHGGDMRLVAVMQYMRVVLVTVLATIISRLWIGAPDSVPATGIHAAWLAGIAWDQLGWTLLLAVLSPLLAQRLKIPGGPLLVTLFLGSFLQAKGVMTIVLPPWILIPTYMAVGWSVGLRFTRQALSQAARALPSIIVSIVCLVTICGAIAVALTHISHIDPLTAYLATSPGGLDSVAIIATSSGVNIPFVMAFQTARLLIVVITGPMLARFIARKIQATSL